MLGRFLEISLHAPEIRESLEFYERLGFAASGEVFLDAGIPHRRMTMVWED